MQDTEPKNTPLPSLLDKTSLRALKAADQALLRILREIREEAS